MGMKQEKKGQDIQNSTKMENFGLYWVGIDLYQHAEASYQKASACIESKPILTNADPNHYVPDKGCELDQVWIDPHIFGSVHAFAE